MSACLVMRIGVHTLAHDGAADTEVFEVRVCGSKVFAVHVLAETGTHDIAKRLIAACNPNGAALRVLGYFGRHERAGRRTAVDEILVIHHAFTHCKPSVLNRADAGKSPITSSRGTGNGMSWVSFSRTSSSIIDISNPILPLPRRKDFGGQGR